MILTKAILVQHFQRPHQFIDGERVVQVHPRHRIEAGDRECGLEVAGRGVRGSV
jgi:hypothetical protein